MWRGDLLFLGSECGQLHVWNASTLTELESIDKHTGTRDDGLMWSCSLIAFVPSLLQLPLHV